MVFRAQRSSGGSEGGRSTGGFTLIELLVVIVIIGILVAVAVTVASKVTAGGRVKLTQEVLKVCDQTMTAAATSLESKAPSKYVDVDGNEYPIVDGRANSDTNFAITNPGEPTAALYFLAVEKLPGLNDMFKGLDAKLVQREASVTSAFAMGNTMNTGGVQPLVVRDGFGRPVRYSVAPYNGGYGTYLGATGMVNNRKEMTVHFTRINGSSPSPQTLDMRRSYRPFPANGTGIGDGDEGIGAPYFYSAGVDGDPGTREDNVYTTKPTFPLETQKFGQ